MVAALPPALEAASARPRMATLRSVAEAGARRAAPRAAIAGGIAALVGGVLIVVSGRSLVVSFAAIFLVMAGAALEADAGPDVEGQQPA
jgi:putative ABC transport system permease protein